MCPQEIFRSPPPSVCWGQLEDGGSGHVLWRMSARHHCTEEVPQDGALLFLRDEWDSAVVAKDRRLGGSGELPRGSSLRAM